MSNSLDFPSKSDNEALFPSGNMILEKLGLDSTFIKTINPRFKRVNYKAVIKWLTTDYQPKDDSNLEKVRPLLESFFHLCEVEDWNRSSAILLIKLNTPINQNFHTQLESWGYYRQQIDIYNRLLDKLNDNWNAICLNALGTAYDSLAEYSKAMEYFENCLNLARQIEDQKIEGEALRGLGITHSSLGEYKTAIDY